MSSFFENTGIFDLISLGFLIFFFILGIFKGFVWQVVRILTIIVGLALAKSLSPSFSNFLKDTISGLKDYDYTIYIAYFVIFVGVFVLGTLLAFMLKKVLKALRIQAYDKILGGFMGLLTGAAIIIVIVMALCFLPDNDLRRSIENSYTAQYSAWAITKADFLVIEELQKKMETIIKENLDRIQAPPTESDETEKAGSGNSGSGR